MANKSLLFAGLAKADEDDEDEINQQIADIIAAIELEGLGVLKNVKNPLADVASDSGEEAIAQLEVPSSTDWFGQVNKAGAAYADARAAELVSDIDDATRNKLHDLIADGIAEGASREDIIESINDMQAFSEERAELIGDNEIRMANGQGKLDGWKEAKAHGVKLKKFWVCGPSSCDECLDNEAQGSIDLEDEFEGTETDTDPGHVNCDCSTGTEMEESDDSDSDDDEDSDEDEDDDVREQRDDSVGFHGKMLKAYNPDQPRDEHGRWGEGSSSYSATMYHGTNTDYSEFKQSLVGATTDSGFYGAGLSLTPNKDFAQHYADFATSQFGGDPQIHTYSVDLKQPLYTKQGAFAFKDAVDSALGRSTSGEGLMPKDITRELVSRGYDGVVVTNSSGKVSEVTVFDPKAITRVRT